MSAIRVKHTLPHRIRFTIPAVRHNDTAARRLEKSLQDMDGILWARTNTKCAGVVVRFDPAVCSESQIMDFFRQTAAQGIV